MGRDPHGTVALADHGRNFQTQRSSDRSLRCHFREGDLRNGLVEPPDQRASVPHPEGSPGKGRSQDFQFRVAPAGDKCDRHARLFRAGERRPVRFGDLLLRVQQGTVEVNGEESETGR